MKIIPVKIKHKKASVPAYVDDWDYEVLKDRKWSLRIYKGKPYARTGFTNRILYPNKRQVYVDMHREIMWRPDGLFIDHIDGNSLNNQRSNLRVCTSSQNQLNRGKLTNNKSGYKGVYWHKSSSKWAVQIAIDQKNYHLGTSDNIKSCAIAYRLFSRFYHGQYAKF